MSKNYHLKNLNPRASDLGSGYSPEKILYTIRHPRKVKKENKKKTPYFSTSPHYWCPKCGVLKAKKIEYGLTDSGWCEPIPQTCSRCGNGNLEEWDSLLEKLEDDIHAEYFKSEEPKVKGLGGKGSLVTGLDDREREVTVIGSEGKAILEIEDSTTIGKWLTEEIKRLEYEEEMKLEHRARVLWKKSVVPCFAIQVYSIPETLEQSTARRLSSIPSLDFQKRQRERDVYVELQTNHS
jgi:hypothetical protein